MKIGTDAILLGAWTHIESNTDKILDVGTGSGIIALMLAQRSAATIVDALEIEPGAYEQAVENFESSKWNDRLFCYHASFAEFADYMDGGYDLIVSNPPYYKENYQTTSDQRNLARFQNSLPLLELFSGTFKLLTKNGLFSLIVPTYLEKKITEVALKTKFEISHRCRVKGNPDSEFVRTMYSFKKTKSKVVTTSHLTIETKRHLYTEDYKNLTKDFYLKF